MKDSFYIIPRSGRLAYLNIPKAACSTILFALSNMRSDSGFHPPEKKLPDGSQPIHGYHPPYTHLENFFCRWPVSNPPLPYLFIKFSFVRNPYERFSSFYKSKIVARQSPGLFYEKFGITEGCSFIDCVRIITSIDPHNLENHAAPQANILSDGKKLYADFIGKIENFQEDWNVINKISGYDIQLEHINKTPSDAAAVYTAESKELIYNYYRNDFELFDYVKDSISVSNQGNNKFNSDVLKKPCFSFDVIDKLHNQLDISNKKIRRLAIKQKENEKEISIFLSSEGELYRELLNKDIFYFKDQSSKEFNFHAKKINSIKKNGDSYGEKLDRLDLSTKKHRQETKENFARQREQITLTRHLFAQHILATYRYARKNPWKILCRFLRSPMMNELKLIRDSGLFDPHYYFENYPGTILGGMAAAKHYVCYGAQEGTNPSAEFNTVKYLIENPCVVHDGVNPLVHFIIIQRDRYT